MKKTAIVTGASTGIGKAIALELAEQYERIAITSYKHPEELMHTKSLLLQQGVECIACSGDSGSYTFVQEFVQTVLSSWGQIDTLINNAGISSVCLLTELSIQEWETLLSTNLSSVFYYCHEVIPFMITFALPMKPCMGSLGEGGVNIFVSIIFRAKGVEEYVGGRCLFLIILLKFI